MEGIFYIISFFWFFRQIRSELFWLYLWQLKEYHFGRFFDHFRTFKGKKIFLNWLLFGKIILLFCAWFLFFYLKFLNWYFYFILFLFYIFETIKFFVDISRKKIKKPVFTQKVLVLFLVNLFFIFLFVFILLKEIKIIYWFIFGLLLFDIFSPFLISFTVLLLQPIVVLLRNQIIKKAKEKRMEYKNLLVIGIVGSYGKTSTKEFLATILSEKFGQKKILKTKEHQNSEIGIAQCILNDLKKEHQIFVCEIGAYNKGKIKEVCNFLKPKIGIITGINEQHLATFGSMKNLLSAEGGKELIESLPKDGWVVINWDNKIIQNLKKEIKNYNPEIKIKFSSTKQKMDIWSEEIKIEKEKISFKVFSKDGDSANFEINLLGFQNVENILLAACCAKELGIKLEEISKFCQKLKHLPHQMEIKKGINNISIIDSSYSTNPNGVISHLDYLKEWPGKKIIIMPCLIELGKASKKVHLDIGKKISEICDLAIITTKDNFKEIKEQAKEKAVFLEQPKKILEKIKNFCQEGDVVLLEGRVSKDIIEILIQ